MRTIQTVFNFTIYSSNSKKSMKSKNDINKQTEAIKSSKNEMKNAVKTINQFSNNFDSAILSMINTVSSMEKSALIN